MKVIKWLLEGAPRGTYVAARLSKESEDKIMEFIKENNIPNALAREDLHTTIIYSRKYLPKFKARGKLEESDYMLAEPIGFALFGEAKNSLVVKLNSPDLTKRHKEIMETHGATFDFDKYEPHVTLSYDCVGFDVDSLDMGELGPLELVEEYDEELKIGKVLK